MAGSSMKEIMRMRPEHWGQLTVLALGLVLGLIGQVGDAAESLLKRGAQIKDSSALIPGHGGLLDRNDSLLFAAPAMYLFLLFKH